MYWGKEAESSKLDSVVPTVPSPLILPIVFRETELTQATRGGHQNQPVSKHSLRGSVCLFVCVFCNRIPMTAVRHEAYHHLFQDR